MIEKNAQKLRSRRMVVALFALFVSGVFGSFPVFAVDEVRGGVTIPPAPHVAAADASALRTAAQQGIHVVLANLQANAKLRAPNDILADFVNGEPETAVIVVLQPTATAKDLASKSRLSAQVPAEFTGPGAATYYDLQDESVKSQLQTTVRETVTQAIDRLDAPGITVTQRFSYQFGFAAKVTPAALEQIVNSPDVVAVEKDYILHAHLAQGVPLMNAAAVRSSYTGSGLSIAICDTGIDTSHPALGGGAFPNAKVIGGYNTGDNNADPRPNSVNGEAHGTACAGIAAGYTGTTGDYIGGVAPDAKLYAIKISTGTTGSASTSAMIAGWEWAVAHKNDDPNNPIMIISTSFGGGSFASTCDAASTSMTKAAANAVAAGITIFASAGNEGFCGSLAWPACISYVNSVGAVYDANFGTYNPCVTADSCAPKSATSGCSTGWYVSESSSPDKVTAYSNSAAFLTLFAPSNKTYTTDIVGAGGYSTGSYYTSFGGTSAACPYAAGAAAVLQQAAKAKTGSYLTPAQVKTYLVNNGDNVTDSKVAVTKPRINLDRAVNALQSMTVTIKTSPLTKPLAAKALKFSLLVTVSSGATPEQLGAAVTNLPVWAVLESTKVVKTSGTIVLQIAATDVYSERQATLLVGNAPFSLKQAGIPCPVPVLSQTGNVTLPAGGGASAAINVILPDGCGWSVGVPSTAAWLTASPAVGSGPGSFTLNAAANDTPKDRKANAVLTTTNGKKKTLVALQKNAISQYAGTYQGTCVGSDLNLNKPISATFTATITPAGVGKGNFVASNGMKGSLGSGTINGGGEIVNKLNEVVGQITLSVDGTGKVSAAAYFSVYDDGYYVDCTGVRQ